MTVQAEELWIRAVIIAPAPTAMKRFVVRRFSMPRSLSPATNCRDSESIFIPYRNSASPPRMETVTDRKSMAKKCVSIGARTEVLLPFKPERTLMATSTLPWLSPSLMSVDAVPSSSVRLTVADRLVPSGAFMRVNLTTPSPAETYSPGAFSNRTVSGRSRERPTRPSWSRPPMVTPPRTVRFTGWRSG